MIHYGTLEGATEYFKYSLRSEPWDCNGDTRRTKALVEATRSIEKLNFESTKEDPTQDMQFPRKADPGVIPKDIEHATYELALSLLDGVNPDIEYENLSMTSQNISGIKSTYTRDSKDDHIICGIVSINAWRLLLPYLRDNNTINIIRV